MGCGQKAVADDEYDWDHLQRITAIYPAKWDVYSNEARFAREGFTSFNLTGSLLLKYIHARMLILDLINEQTQKDKEIAILRELQAKYPEVKR